MLAAPSKICGANWQNPEMTFAEDKVGERAGKGDEQGAEEYEIVA